MNNNEDLIFYGLVIAGIILVMSIGLGITLFKATQEAHIFNKFSEKEEATTWDALFANLRVEACN